jgi:hypothetical protein
MQQSTGKSCLGCLILCAILVACFFFGGGWKFISSLSPSARATSTAEVVQAATNNAIAHTRLLNENGDIPNLHDPGSSYSPYIKGKVVIIDKPEKKLDTSLLEASDPLLATTPAEVGTVIWVNCQSERLNYSYNHISPATWWHCDITVIDKAKATVVGSKHFDGQYPPETIKCRYSICSCCDPPDSDMGKYVQSLPKK